MLRLPGWFKRRAVPWANTITYASDAYVGLKSTVNDLSSVLINFDHAPGGAADERLMDLVQLIRPWTYEGLQMVRVGGDHDGGYIMANVFDVTGAISIGIGTDVTWDLSITSKGIPVAMFDPTIKQPPMVVNEGRFLQIGLGPSKSEGTLRTLGEILELANFGENEDLILKVDIEGAEWTAFQGVEAEELTRFKQMVFELHDIRNLQSVSEASSIIQTLRKFNSSHMPVHVHANNYDSLVRFDRYWFPNTIEVSYIRRDLMVNPSPKMRVRCDLDAPCDSRVSDICIEGIAGVSMGPLGFE